MSPAEEPRIIRQNKNHIPSIDYTPIVFSDDKIDHARAVVAGSSKDAEDARLLLEHLGLLPGTEGWYSNGDPKE